MNHRCLALLIIVVTAGFPRAGQGQEPLRWKLKKGQLLRVGVIQESVSETVIRASSLKMSVTRGFELDWAVKEVDEKGVARIEQSFARLHLKMDSPNVPTIEYDSASQTEPDEAAEQLAKSLAPLLKLKFHVVMSPQGAIQDVQLPTESNAALGALPPEVKQIFTKESLQRTLQQAAQPLPTKAISPGDTWSAESKATTRLGQMINKSQYLFDGMVSRQGTEVAKISVVTKIELKPSKRASESKFRLKQQDQKAVMYFNPVTGLLLESQSDQTLMTETKKKDLVMETRSKTSMRTSVRLLKDAQ